MELKILSKQSRNLFQMIDVDDPDPDTWLADIRSALGDAVELIVKTKNGFHVIFRSRKLTRESHRRLREVLEKDTGKGKDASVTQIKGTLDSCALPGTFQAGHPTSLLYCSCHHKSK